MQDDFTLILGVIKQSGYVQQFCKMSALYIVRLRYSFSGVEGRLRQVACLYSNFRRGIINSKGKLAIKKCRKMTIVGIIRP